MGNLGAISWRVFEKFLIEQGCLFKRMKGDHRVYTKNGLKRPLIVPQYNPLPPFIILNNLRVLGVSKEDLLNFISNT
jgi:predicted RNA binding protein YcfA (HicA-like mRNA interferase family)